MKKGLLLLLTAMLLAGCGQNTTEQVHKRSGTMYICQTAEEKTTVESHDFSSSAAADILKLIESSEMKAEVMAYTGKADFYIFADDLNDSYIYEITVAGDREEDLVEICNAVLELLPGFLSERIEGIQCKVIDLAHN